MPYHKDENEIGALWIKASAKGEYLSGIINGQRVVCFLNNKKSEKQPDWRVLKAKLSEERGGGFKRVADDDEMGF